jgi:hypothetical protein
MDSTDNKKYVKYAITSHLNLALASTLVVSRVYSFEANRLAITQSIAKSFFKVVSII